MSPPDGPSPALAAALEGELDRLLARIAPALAADRVPPLPRPRLRFFQHRLDAGRALAAELPGEPGTIELNTVYLEREGWDSAIATLGHELAHLVVFHRFPGRRVPPHGQAWRRIMTQWLGLPAERTHRFSTEGLKVRRQRRWPYHCGCRAHALSTVRHHRAQKGARYQCRCCGEALVFAPKP
jgi:SprT protein